MYSKRLKELRLKKQLTKRDVANTFNVSESTYGKWELGQRKPDLETIANLAEFYEVTTDYLLGVSDDPTPSDMQKPTPETVGPALEAMLRAHGYLQNDQPLTDEEADEILRITKAVWEARRPPKKVDS